MYIDYDVQASYDQVGARSKRMPIKYEKYSLGKVGTNVMPRVGLVLAHSISLAVEAHSLYS